MRTTLVLATVAILAGTLGQAERLANGLEFAAPAGWTVRANPQVAVLFPPDVAMEANGRDPSELYIVAGMPGVQNPQGPQLISTLRSLQLLSNLEVRPVGTAQPLRTAGGTGWLHSYDAASEGVAMRLQVYVVPLSGGGSAALLAMGRPAMVARRQEALLAMAASLSRGAGGPSGAPVTTGGGLVAQWEQRLRGHKLYKFSGYSSGYGSGGYNSQSTLLLAANGAYEFRRSSSVSVYVDGASGGSASRGGSQGHWRIYEQGGRAMLELVSSSGTETIALTADGSKTLLNGQRWLVGN